MLLKKNVLEHAVNLKQITGQWKIIGQIMVISLGWRGNQEPITPGGINIHCIFFHTPAHGATLITNYSQLKTTEIETILF